jgi:hypothetical protein
MRKDMLNNFKDDKLWVTLFRAMLVARSDGHEMNRGAGKRFKFYMAGDKQ